MADEIVHQVIIDNMSPLLSYADRYRVYTDVDDAIAWAKLNGYDNMMPHNEKVGQLNFCKCGDVNIGIMASVVRHPEKKAVEDPTKGMSEDEFIEHYKPETEEDGSVYVQRDFNTHCITIKQAIEENRLWTMITGEHPDNEDEDAMYLVLGHHIVNRLYSVVCEVSAGDLDFLEVYCD